MAIPVPLNQELIDAIRKERNDALDKWRKSGTPHNYVVCVSDVVEEILKTCHNFQHRIQSNGTVNHEWKFQFGIDYSEEHRLRHVALIEDRNRENFTLTSVQIGQYDVGFFSDYNQEWFSRGEDVFAGSTIRYTIKINCTCQRYGTYRQNVILLFGSEPIHLFRLCVDHISSNYEMKQTELTSKPQWSMRIKPFPFKEEETKEKTKTLIEDTLDEMVMNLSKIYPRPTKRYFIYTQQTNTQLSWQNITLQDYQDYWHDLLYMEENARNRILFTKCGQYIVTLMSHYKGYKDGEHITLHTWRNEYFGQVISQSLRNFFNIAYHS